MRLHELPPSLLIVLAVLLPRSVTASFLPDLLPSFENLQDVQKRCDNPCGYYKQLCCESDEVCYTDSNNQAQCGAGASAATTVAATAATGQWQYYTTTYVQTDLKTVTETFSSFVPTTTVGCAYSLGETPCGSACCLSGQYCQSSGICVAVGGDSSAYYSSLYTVTTVITNTASAPLRPTSNSLVTVTSTGTATGSATTTQGFITPVSSSGSIIYGQSTNSGGGLSGGAIAGIVIGVILGIIILLLICACWCAKGLIDGLLSIFGLGPRKRRTTEEVIYESHSHRDRRGGRTWFGQQRPSRTEVVEEKRTSGLGGIGTAGWVAAGLGTLALWLGLKRRNRRDDKSDVSYDSAYYTDYMYSSKSTPS